MFSRTMKDIDKEGRDCNYRSLLITVEVFVKAVVCEILSWTGVAHGARLYF